MKILVILITLFISYGVSAEGSTFNFKRGQIKTINVVAPMWEDYTNVDGTGMYWEIVRSIYSSEGIRLKHSIVPWNRAMKMVTKYQTYNAIIGEYRETEEALLFPKYPIDVEYMSVLTKKSTESWQGLGSLAGKRIGWMKDYDVINEDQRDFTLREYRTTEQGLELLNAGELDYIIDEWDELASALKDNNLAIENYNMNDMPEGTDVYVAFADSEVSKILIEIYNEQVEAMVASGQMQAIYKKWDLGEMPQSLQSAGR
ncbi:MAG: polar amino acid transport system substrate-binding protein [Oleispira sp.]|jgi:polar amino acid transport system substrate-binding protein